MSDKKKQNEEAYLQLEKQFVRYRDLINIVAQENFDEFVALAGDVNNIGVIGKYHSLDDMKSVSPQVIIRQTVKVKLENIDRALKKINPDLQLIVAYGYRSLEIQQQYFLQQKNNLLFNKSDTNENINEIVHRLIAVPEVAGHPTGGAVDIYIQDIKRKTTLDFGTEIFTFDSKDVYTFSPFINEEAKQNRLLLRKLMLGQGFAPYDGEWWHFSYGDKEWAFYYRQEYAVYQQKDQDFVMNDVYSKDK